MPSVFNGNGYEFLLRLQESTKSDYATTVSYDLTSLFIIILNTIGVISVLAILYKVYIIDNNKKGNE